MISFNGIDFLIARDISARIQESDRATERKMIEPGFLKVYNRMMTAIPIEEK